MAKKKPRYKVFVSYSRHDEAFVKPLSGLLGVAADDTIFLDIDAVKPGELWEEEIERAIRGCSVFILCWCCQSSKSDVVQKEIALALEDKEKRFVPVRFCATPLPKELAKRQWISLHGQIVHECTRHLPKGPPSSIYVPDEEEPQEPQEPIDRPALPSKRSLVPWTLVAGMFIVGLFIAFAPKEPIVELPSGGIIVTCAFQDGPKAGQRDFVSARKGVRVGDACEDAGDPASSTSTGKIVDIPNQGIVGSGPEVDVLTVLLVLLLMLGMLIAMAMTLFRIRRRSKDSETNSIADRATEYFQGLPWRG